MRRTAIALGILEAAWTRGSSLFGVDTIFREADFVMEPAPTTASLTTRSTTETRTIKIGFLVPFSRPFAADAGDFGNAAQMVADELNGAGGICGAGSRYKFDLVKADTESQRSDAVVTGFRRLNADNDLNFIMAPYASTSNFRSI
jgi:ABC-type branched-subunit amino acid transport system substrate-binding protein